MLGVPNGLQCNAAVQTEEKLNRLHSQIQRHSTAIYPTHQAMLQHMCTHLLVMMHSMKAKIDSKQCCCNGKMMISHKRATAAHLCKIIICVSAASSMQHLSSKQSLQPLQQGSMPVCQLMLHGVAIQCSACQEQQPTSTGCCTLATSMHSGMTSCLMATQ